MTEQELIQALRDLIAKTSTDSPDPRLLARDINRSDQRRIRWLAGLSIFFWLLAAAGLMLLVLGLHHLVVYVRTADHYPAAQPKEPFAPRNQPHADTREIYMLRGTGMIHHSLGVVAGSVGALFLAALCTVLLVTTSRRATLRQINLSLMELSEQVRQLRAANPSEKVRRPESP